MSEPITIIGVNTVVSGNLEGDEDLTIEGRVEGSISLSKTVTIETNGVVHANINVRNAVISGVLVGNVQAEESVHITEEGRVVGDIAAPRVILVDGASFRGSIDMGDFDVERGEAASAGREALMEAPARAPASYRQEAAEEEEPRAPARVRRGPGRPAGSKNAPAAKPAAKKTTKRKSPPAPKVRSVGKSKAAKKKRG